MAADEATQQAWKIAENVGLPVSDEIKFYETLRDEFGRITSHPARHEIAGLFVDWRRTRNPHYIDRAVVLCDKYGLFTETVLSEIADCAKRRTGGTLPGTDGQIDAKNDKSWCLMLMLNIRFHRPECSIRAASEMAASAFSKANSNKKPFKASTLERYYCEQHAKSTEPEYFQSWRRHREAADSQMKGQYRHDDELWKVFIDAIPPCPDDLRGDRR